MSAILAANHKDVAAGEAAGMSPAMLDRLALDPARIRAMAEAAVGRLLERRTHAQLPPLRMKVPVTLRLS